MPNPTDEVIDSKQSVVFDEAENRPVQEDMKTVTAFVGSALKKGFTYTATGSMTWQAMSPSDPLPKSCQARADAQPERPLFLSAASAQSVVEQGLLTADDADGRG